MRMISLSQGSFLVETRLQATWCLLGTVMKKKGLNARGEDGQQNSEAEEPKETNIP